MRASETFQTVTLELFTVCTHPYDEGLLLLIAGQELSSLNLWRLLPSDSFSDFSTCALPTPPPF